MLGNLDIIFARFEQLGIPVRLWVDGGFLGAFGATNDRPNLTRICAPLEVIRYVAVIRHDISQ